MGRFGTRDQPLRELPVWNCWSEGNSNLRYWNQAGRCIQPGDFDNLINRNPPRGREECAISYAGCRAIPSQHYGSTPGRDFPSWRDGLVQPPHGPAGRRSENVSFNVKRGGFKGLIFFAPPEFKAWRFFLPSETPQERAQPSPATPCPPRLVERTFHYHQWRC